MDQSGLFTTDQMLWDSFRQGDIRAFEQIYRLHAGALLAYGNRLSSEADQVADAVQDVFLEIWKRRATLTTPTTIRFYLFRVLRNRLIGHFNRTVDTINPSDYLTDLEEALTSPSIETLLTEADTRQRQQTRLRQAIDLLPPRQQEAITLAYYHQFSNEEIARIMGINPQSVTNHLSRAILTLRELLAKALWLISWLVFSWKG